MSRSAETRSDVTDLLHRFATAIDTCDWLAYRSVFTDEIELDYSSWRPTSIGRWSADDWVDRATRLFPGLTATRHALSNPLVSVEAVDPDEPGWARIRVNVAADHVVVDDDGNAEVFTLNGHYDDGCVLTDAGWRIAEKRLVVEWTTGDRTLLERAAARVATGDPLRKGC